MVIRNKFITLAAPAAMLLLASCGPMAFRADVSRFQQLPAPAGQTFIVQAANPRMQGGIEFSQYADLVEQRLTQQGYRAAEGGQANLIVTIDYGVDNGQQRIVSRPGFGGWGGYGGFGGWGGGFGRGFGYGGWGGGYGGWGGGFGRGGLYGRGWYGGWGDPFWYQPFGTPQIDSYTVYLSHLDMRIRNASDGRTVFEGRARARSTDDSLPRLVPNLVEAMFTGFPGRSGEDVLITVPPPPRPGGQAPINRG